ncbi:MAG: nitroreductase family protein [Candidatus Aminicenantes bacterium]|jgi:nitroreductase/ketosteroid isomerase-like protein
MNFSKKHIFCLTVFLLFFSSFPFLTPAEENQPGLSLKETFDVYVQAIHNSDLKSLFTTVTDSHEFFFLTSTGQLIDSREGYSKFHQDWFKETGWEMPVELLEVHEGQEYGYTVAKFHYKQNLPGDGKYNLDSYFTLIFHREEGMWKVVGDVCTPIERYQTEVNPEIKYSSDQTYIFNTIKNRRTVRKFKDTPVPREHVLKVLDAARFAPTAGNQQPWKFLVIRNREKLNHLQKEALSWYLEGYKIKRNPTDEQLSKASDQLERVLKNVLSAPVYVAVLADSQAQYPDYILYDGTLAAGYLMIAARALGYGTGFFTSFFPEAKMKEFFKIPEQYRLICFTPIGVPLEWPKTPSKKNLDDVVIFEKF